MGSEILEGLRLELAQGADATTITRLVLRSLLAVVLGGLIGYERERRGKAAGIRTQMIVCLGTTYFVALPSLMGFGPESLSRIIQGITAGLGFLGAGAIMKHEREERIEGLTTAASVWFTAAIGVAVGLGLEIGAAIGAVLALVVLALVPRYDT